MQENNKIRKEMPTVNQLGANRNQEQKKKKKKLGTVVTILGLVVFFIWLFGFGFVCLRLVLEFGNFRACNQIILMQKSYYTT